MQPRELLKTASLLANSGRQPRQTDLRRAVSTAYYVLFHSLAQSCADGFIGRSASARREPAWMLVYRALNHRPAKLACANRKSLSRFPQQIQDFADQFVAMQEKRHIADYDPTVRIARSDVLNDLKIVEATIDGFDTVPRKIRAAFAALVLFPARQ